LTGTQTGYFRQTVPNNLNSGIAIPQEEYPDEIYDPDNEPNLRRCSSITTVLRGGKVASVSVFYDAEWRFDFDFREQSRTPSSRRRSERLVEALHFLRVVGSPSSG
jgi:hypothetical protein